MRYTIDTISSNRTQFNTAIIWLIRVQLSVILPGLELECKESWDVLQYNDIFHFGNFPAQYQLSNDFSFKQIQNLLTNTTKTSKLQKCIWKYHFIRTSKTLHIVQVTFQRRCAALLTKRRKLLFNLREIVPMYLSSQDTSTYIMYCGNDDSEPVTYFLNEQSMWSFLANVIGTHLGKFFVHDYIISRSFVPHLTPNVQIFEVEIFKSSSQFNHMSWFSVF